MASLHSKFALEDTVHFMRNNKAVSASIVSMTLYRASRETTVIVKLPTEQVEMFVSYLYASKELLLRSL